MSGLGGPRLERLRLQADDLGVTGCGSCPGKSGGKPGGAVISSMVTSGVVSLIGTHVDGPDVVEPLMGSFITPSMASGAGGGCGGGCPLLPGSITGSEPSLESLSPSSDGSLNHGAGGCPGSSGGCPG